MISAFNFFLHTFKQRILIKYKKKWSLLLKYWKIVPKKTTVWVLKYFFLLLKYVYIIQNIA